MLPLWDPAEAEDESVYAKHQVHPENLISVAYRPVPNDEFAEQRKDFEAILAQAVNIQFPADSDSPTEN